MSTKISTKKGALASGNVLISFGVSWLTIYLAKKTGITMTPDQQAQLQIFLTALISGAITGVVNWIKHLPKK